jgi:hypothetical protein
VHQARTAARRTQDSQRLSAIAVIVLCVALLAGIAVWDTSTRTVTVDTELQGNQISVFTVVDTGIVFVKPDTSEIVWRNLGGDQMVIGEDPWRNPSKALPSDLTGFPAWREERDIVGHPGHDLVSWVETVDGERGDLVVVQASTGILLARTTIAAPDDYSVVIASVDENSVYFGTPDPASGFPDMPGNDTWTWRWAAGDTPEPPQRGTPHAPCPLPAAHHDND